MENLAWPFVVLVVFFYLREDVRALLKRANRLEAIGVSLSSEPAQQPMATDNRAVSATEETDSPTMREQIKHIEQILSLEEKTDKDEIIKTLKRTAANLHLWWRFEEISSLIFGTQLALLFFLKSRPEGMTKEEVAPYYQAHLDQLKASEVKRPIDHWLGWLKMQMLIREQGERIFLTHYADDFMQWIYNRGKTYRRMF